MAAPAAALGADPEQLTAAARSLRERASTLDAVCGGIEHRLRITSWKGPDADRFRTEWSRSHQRELRRVRSALSACAAELERNAKEQRSASMDAPAITGLPDRELRFVGGVDVRIGPVVLHGGRELTFAELDNGLTRVTLIGAAGVGVAAGVGATAGLNIGDQTALGAAADGLSADARARLGGIERLTWEVPPDEVDELLVALGADAAIDTAFGAIPAVGAGDRVSGLVGAAAGVFDRAVGGVTGWDPGLADLVTVPEPSRSEYLAEVDLSASAAVGTGAVAVGGAALATQTARAGWSRRGDDTSMIVETSGTATAAVTSTLLRRVGLTAPAAQANVSTRWELPVAGPTAELDPHLLVRVTSGDGSTAQDTLVRVDLRDSPGIRDAIDHLVAGRVADAASALASIDLHPESVMVLVEDSATEGHTVRAGAKVAAGIGLGVTGRGQVLETTRD